MSDIKRKRTILKISEKEEAQLWQDALIVWDTSALCRLYSLTSDARDEMLAILDILKESIWLPSRVVTEFFRHNDEELQKPLSHYVLPKFLGASHISKEFSEYVTDLKNDTYRHPNINSETITKLEGFSIELNELLEKIRVTISDAIKEGKSAYAESIKQDPIAELIDNLPQGESLTYTELRALVTEGHIRFKHRIPPGYEDEATKDSIDVFGDLIIWKEIIKKSKNDNVPIILVIQDLKEDWNAVKDPDTIVPREELVYEFNSETKQKIWMYTVSDFLLKLNKYKIGVKSLENPLRSIDKIKRELGLAAISDDCIKVECPHCKRIIGYSSDDFDWDWNWVGQEDRQMGVELSYRFNAQVECPNCEEYLSFDFDAYIYPLGVVNYVDCESDDCDILHKPNDLLRFIEFPESTLETCCRCGGLTDELNEFGFCPDCQQEIDDIFNDD